MQPSNWGGSLLLVPPIRSTDNARMEVMEATSEDSKKALIKSWLDKEAVPIDQAEFGTGSSKSLVNKIFSFFVQRPMAIFGLLYFVKKLLLYLEELGKDEIEGEGGEL